LSARGLVVVIPDYRLHLAVQYPAFMSDVAQAVAWAHENARRFGGDPEWLFLMGHSAGATMALRLALDPEYLLAAEVPICGVVGVAGLYDYPVIPNSKRYPAGRQIGPSRSRWDTSGRPHRPRCC
jgi:acetyl esterase/lipase